MLQAALAYPNPSHSGIFRWNPGLKPERPTHSYGCAGPVGVRPCAERRLHRGRAHLHPDLSTAQAGYHAGAPRPA
ncbi:MAG: hypothetical protein WKG07_45720 [Hymenobacter sp.]